MNQFVTLRSFGVGRPINPQGRPKVFRNGLPHV
jgi:hypothetical protein